MPLLILADVYRCSDAYEYGTPEHYMAKKYFNEAHVANLLKFAKREFKQCSYWFIRITRVDMDKDEFVTTELITHKNKLKKRIQLNAHAKPETPNKRVRTNISSTMPTPSASLAEMVAHMEAMQAAQVPLTQEPTTSVGIGSVSPSIWANLSNTTIGPLP
jgi:hypothetical protein